MRFRSKERGTRVKDHAKNGSSKRAGRGWGRNFHFLALVSFLARPKPRIPFLGLSLLLNRRETLATQAKPSIACITGGEDADPPSRVSGAPRALRARLSSPDKRDKITPVMQANFLKWPPKMQIITFRVREVIASKNRIAIVSPES